jgi:hydrogenase expression/formation protein HypC
LAIPMRIIIKQGDKATVEAGGMRYEVSISLLPDVRIDDYVLVHAGFAIQKLDKEEADRTLALFEELNNTEC